MLEGAMGMAMASQMFLPAVAGGLVLIVTGRILRVVIDNSGA